MTEQQSIVTIKDRTYIINAFAGTKGLQLFAKLSKNVFPALAKMLAAKGKALALDENGVPVLSKEDSAEWEAMGDAFKELFMNGEEDVVSLVIDLVSNVTVDSGKLNIDTEFKQNYFALLTLALEAIRLNYADVFQELGMNF